MRFTSARQAWNLAFCYYGPGIDYRQVSGGDSRLTASDAFWNNAERGVIIAAVHYLREHDFIAYCWGMTAYTSGLEVTTERTQLERYMLDEFAAQRPHVDIEAQRRSISILADQALQDAIRDDNLIEDDKPCRRSRGHFIELSKRMGIEHEVFFTRYRRHYDLLRDIALDLPVRALGHLGGEIQRRLKEKALDD